MGRLFSRSLALFATLGVTGLISQGCADNESILFVRDVLYIEPPDCTTDPDPNSTFRPFGVVDLAFGNSSYYAYLLVGNQMVRRGSKNQVRTESSRIVLKGAEVTLLDDNDNTIGSSFTSPGSGFVDPGVGEDPGYGILGVELVPGNLSASPGQRIVVEVRAFGDTLGGQEVTSAPMHYPIYFCNKCLISFPSDADDPVQPGYQCSSATDSSDPPPCFLGQDRAVDCRLCLGYPACQAP